MSEVPQRISNKLADDRLQLVFPGEPVIDDIGDAEYGSEEALQATYQVDFQQLRAEVADITDARITVSEAAIGIGAPLEGWLIDVYKTVAPAAKDIAAWVTLATFVTKLVQISVKYARVSRPDAKPILSRLAIEALAIRRFTRYRIKRKYELRGSQLFYGQPITTYEPWDVFMVTIAKENSKRIFVLFIDCFGNFKGKVSFLLDRKYDGEFGYD